MGADQQRLGQRLQEQGWGAGVLRRRADLEASLKTGLGRMGSLLLFPSSSSLLEGRLRAPVTPCSSMGSWSPRGPSLVLGTQGGLQRGRSWRRLCRRGTPTPFSLTLAPQLGTVAWHPHSYVG